MIKSAIWCEILSHKSNWLEPFYTLKSRIQNVNQRIKIMFGDKYGVRLMPGDEDGLMVYLAFPIMDLLNWKNKKRPHTSDRYAAAFWGGVIVSIPYLQIF